MPGDGEDELASEPPVGAPHRYVLPQSERAQFPELPCSPVAAGVAGYGRGGEQPQQEYLPAKALGEPATGQSYIETVPRVGYRFAAPVTEIASKALGPKPEGRHVESPARQEIRFCSTRDGVRIAWATVGAGYPLVKAANWLNHLDYEWESPVWKHWIAELTKHHRFVRYDERGNGLSDWEVKEMSSEAWAQDLETVVEAAVLTGSR